MERAAADQHVRDAARLERAHVGPRRRSSPVERACRSAGRAGRRGAPRSGRARRPLALGRPSSRSRGRASRRTRATASGSDSSIVALRRRRRSRRTAAAPAARRSPAAPCDVRPRPARAARTRLAALARRRPCSGANAAFTAAWIAGTARKLLRSCDAARRRAPRSRSLDLLVERRRRRGGSGRSTASDRRRRTACRAPAARARQSRLGGIVGREQQQDLGLQRIGVLELVDEEVREAALQLRAHVARRRDRDRARAAAGRGSRAAPRAPSPLVGLDDGQQLVAQARREVGVGVARRSRRGALHGVACASSTCGRGTPRAYRSAFAPCVQPLALVRGERDAARASSPSWSRGAHLLRARDLVDDAPRSARGAADRASRWSSARALRQARRAPPASASSASIARRDRTGRVATARGKSRRSTSVQRGALEQLARPGIGRACGGAGRARTPGGGALELRLRTSVEAAPKQAPATRSGAHLRRADRRRASTGRSRSRSAQNAWIVPMRATSSLASAASSAVARSSPAVGAAAPSRSRRAGAASSRRPPSR